jgi:hypothetical protein
MNGEQDGRSTRLKAKIALEELGEHATVADLASAIKLTLDGEELSEFSAIVKTVVPKPAYRRADHRLLSQLRSRPTAPRQDPDDGLLARCSRHRTHLLCGLGTLGALLRALRIAVTPPRRGRLSGGIRIATALFLLAPRAFLATVTRTAYPRSSGLLRPAAVSRSRFLCECACGKCRKALANRTPAMQMRTSALDGLSASRPAVSPLCRIEVALPQLTI